MLYPSLSHSSHKRKSTDRANHLQYMDVSIFRSNSSLPGASFSGLEVSLKVDHKALNLRLSRRRRRRQECNINAKIMVDAGAYFFACLTRNEKIIGNTTLDGITTREFGCCVDGLYIWNSIVLYCRIYIWLG